MNLVEEFDFPDKVCEKLLPMGFRIWKIFLADEMFINLNVMQKDRLTTCALAKFFD
jgi:hypothetical protein